MLNRRSILQLIGSVSVIAGAGVGVGPALAADKLRIAMVVKALGNGFFDACHDGGLEAAKELGNVDLIYTGPTKATAEEQIAVIDSLIAQKVDAIAISANDTNALVPVCKKAMGRGIKVISFDSGIAPEGRIMHLNPSNNALIGAKCVQMMAATLKGEGDVAILSATAQATNQNIWIEEMKKEWAKPDYAKMKLVATVYGDDVADKSYRETQGLIKAYPNLKGIIAPTSVGIVAAAKAVVDAGLVGKVYVTGLGLPSEMKGAVLAGATDTFAIWNPIDLGYSITTIAALIAQGKATGKPGVDHRLGGGDDADRGRRDDALEVRIGFDQALHLAIALVRDVVAVDGRDQLHLGIFGLGPFLLHHLDPDVLVRGLRGGGENGDVALVVQGLGHHLQALGADELIVGRVEMHDSAFGRDAGIERDHLDAAADGFLADGHQGVGVVGGNRDAVDLLRDQRIDDGDLLLGGGLGRAGVDQFDIAELLGGFHAAVAAGVEETVAERLGHQGDAQIVGREYRRDAARGGDRNASHQLQYGTSIQHGFLLLPSSHRLNATCSIPGGAGFPKYRPELADAWVRPRPAPR